jgi:sugar/nucleoside kinase (ribokinase family)
MLDEALFEGSSLCVVGNINRDVKTAPFTPGNLLHDGETSVDSIIETIGGGGANSAFAAAALRARVAFLGKVGDDALGARIEKTLRRHGISGFLAKDKSRPSGTSLALAFDTGARHFVSCLPASRALSFADLDLSALEKCEHLLRGDIWFSEPMLYGGNKELFQAARERGLAVSIDLNWDPHWGVADQKEIQKRKEAVRSVLPLVNLAHGNARELMEFSDTTDLKDALKSLADWGVEAVVVHLGEKGAGYYCDDSLLIEPPVPASKHVNATGTGDVLSVCMMLLHRKTEVPIRERLKLANKIVAQFIEGRLQLIPELAG